MKPIEISAATKELEGKVNEKLLEIKAYGECCEETPITRDQINCLVSSLYSYFDRERSYMSSQINDMWNMFYKYMDEHQVGHAPKLTAAATAKYLKTFGLEDGYEIVKKPIYVTANIRGQNTLIVE